VIPFAVTVKFAVSVPAATVTLAGTVAAAVLFDARVTTTPPVVAAPAKVTVPAEVAPPNTLEGFSVIDCGTGARIGRANLKIVPPNACAVKFAVILLVTGVAVIANVPVVEPEGTDIVAGTVTWPRSEVKLTV